MTRRIPRRNGHGVTVTGGVVLLAACLLLGGCAYTRTRSSQALTASLNGENKLLENGAGQKDVEAARRMIEAGQISAGIPRLQLIMSKYPDAESALDARYWLGVAYRDLKSYKDAIEFFDEYLEMAPEGRYAEQSAAYAAELSAEYEQKFWTTEKIDARLAEVTQALAASPGDIQLEWEMADLQWKRGDYTRAGQRYAALVKKWPELGKHPTVTGRIEFLPGGAFTVLTPSETLRRAAEAQPLVILNVNAFETGRDQISYAGRGNAVIDRGAYRYVVTGQVTNRAESVLYGVQVMVTIYGFGNVVYDTKTIGFGRLNPGDTRAFSVQFSVFDNIENIQRYECTGIFQR